MKAAVLFAALVGLGSSAALAQAPGQTSSLTPTFHSSAALVALNVTVQDRSAKFVRDLQPADFVVYEDGVKQHVEFFESARVPVDLIVMLDTSASMRRRMALVHEAASGFLRTLREGDRGAVVSFATGVDVLQPLTSDQSALQQAVRGTSAAGDTSLNTAIYITLKDFGMAAEREGDVRRQAIVVLSDGADTSSAIGFDDVIDLARRTGVSIYTVSLQSGEMRDAVVSSRRFETDAADNTMKTLARETGAQAFFPTEDKLKTVYAAIASELASQYSIGYVPVNPAPDGTFRHVNVQIVTRPQLFSRTRLGYIAGAVSPLPLGRRLGGE